MERERDATVFSPHPSLITSPLPSSLPSPHGTDRETSPLTAQTKAADVGRIFQC